MRRIKLYNYSRIATIPTVSFLFFNLAACGGGGGEGAPSPVVVEPITEEEDLVTTPPTMIELTHFALKSQSDTRPEDNSIEIQTTWNQGAFTFEFSAEAFDASTGSTRYDYHLYLSKDTVLDLEGDKYFKAGSCDTNDVHTGYECDPIEVQYCRFYPESSYYVGSCRNRLGQTEYRSTIPDLITQLPENLNALFQVCHTNNDTGFPFKECVSRVVPILVY